MNFIRKNQHFFILLIIISALYGTIALFSPYVAYNVFPDLTPIIIYIFLAGLCGLALFMFAYYLLRALAHHQMDTKSKPFITLMSLMVLIGFLSRLLMFQSTPILEDDWFRYLWDGGVSAEKINPFKYPPAAAFIAEDLSHSKTLSAEQTANNQEIKKLKELSKKHDQFAYQTNYPYLVTIYPTGAQLAFFAANTIAPFELNGWRLILLLFDSVALFLLIKLLFLNQKNILWASLYWLNPIVILEGFNSAHMDILLVPVLLSSVYFTHKQKPILTGTMLAIAVSIKIWPLLLAPLFIGPLIKTRISLQSIVQNKSILAAFIIPFLLISFLSLYPLLISANQPESGLGAYSQEWQKNGFLFSVLNNVTALFGDDTGKIARILIALCVTLLTLTLSLMNKNAEKLPTLILIVISTMFFLAPAGYPWYSIWFLPFLPLTLSPVIPHLNIRHQTSLKANAKIGLKSLHHLTLHPSMGLIILTALLPLYYLRFPLYEAGYYWFFNWIIVPIEFGIPILFILYTLKQSYSDQQKRHSNAR